MSVTVRQETCEGRIDRELARRLEDIRERLKTAEAGGESGEEDLLGYGLEFDFVTAGTWKGQREGYFRWQLSYGGPSDEFRLFTDARRGLHRVEYWFLDWFDGAHRELSGEPFDALAQVYAEFDEVGARSSRRCATPPTDRRTGGQRAWRGISLRV